MPARRKPKKRPIRNARSAKRKFNAGGRFDNGGLLTSETNYQWDPNAPQYSDSTWGALPPGGIAGTMISINATEGEDKLTDTQKITSGYFSSGVGTLNASSIHTGSTATSNNAYYVNIVNGHPLSASTETQFSVAYGHIGGSGSDTNAGDIEGASKAIYGQWTTTLLGETEISGGFRISNNEGNNPTYKALTGRDPDIYVLVGKRERFKDRINAKNWTIAVSGSTSANGAGTTVGAKLLSLTDDSSTTTGTGTVAGIRYNIVSGALGTVDGNGASDRVFGWFYPEMGVMVFSVAQLSASIPGTANGINMTASFNKGKTNKSFKSCSGFAPNTTIGPGDPSNAVRFANCLVPNGTKITLRAEEDQISTSYFCRVRSKDLNFSNNPTFVSGSSNEISNPDMWGNPNVYITGIGLYGSNGVLVAIGKLSTPLSKNFSQEATIKVKLTY